MRILFLADVHANAAMLERVLAHAQGAFDEVILLGDYVGYGPDPLATIELLRALPTRAAVLGNHDTSVLRLARGATVGGRADLVAMWEKHAASLTTDALAWLERIPMRDHVILDAEPEEHEGFGHLKLDVIHGHPDPTTPFRYLDGIPAARAARAHIEGHALAFAHTHVPTAIRSQDGVLRPVQHGALARGVTLRAGQVLFNPGSVHESRDGGAAGCFAILDADLRSVAFHRAGNASWHQARTFPSTP